MIKTTIAALLLTTSAAVALDDRNNINLNYSDFGNNYVDAVEKGTTDTFDSTQATLSIDGRNGIVEYSGAVNEDDVQSVTLGAALPIGGSGFGVVGGISADTVMNTDDYYYGAIYETGSVELRATYQDDAEDFKVSGRYYLTDSWGLNAGVQFEDEVDEDSTYTIGVSYKF